MTKYEMVKEIRYKLLREYVKPEFWINSQKFPIEESPLYQRPYKEIKKVYENI